MVLLVHFVINLFFRDNAVILTPHLKKDKVFYTNKITYLVTEESRFICYGINYNYTEMIVYLKNEGVKVHDLKSFKNIKKTAMM